MAMAARVGADRRDHARCYFGSSGVKTVFRVLCPAAIVVLALCPSLFAQQPTLQKIRVLCLNRPLPVVAAQSQGIFAKYGIEVEFMVVPGSEALRNDLAAGKGDVAFVAAWTMRSPWLSRLARMW